MYFINDWLKRDNVHILKASSYFAFLFGYKNITKAVLFNSFTTAACSSGHNSVTTGARYSGQILIICNIDKQIAQNMRTCLSDLEILLPEVGHLSGYFISKW